MQKRPMVLTGLPMPPQRQASKHPIEIQDFAYEGIYTYIYVHTCMPAFCVDTCTRMYICTVKLLGADLSEHPLPLLASPALKPSRAQPTARTGREARLSKPGCQPVPEPAAQGEAELPCPCAPPRPSPRPGARRGAAEPRPGRSGGGAGSRRGRAPAATGAEGSRTNVSPGAARRALREPRLPLRSAAPRAAALPELSPSSDTDELSVSSSSELLPSFSP